MYALICALAGCTGAIGEPDLGSENQGGAQGPSTDDGNAGAGDADQGTGDADQGAGDADQGAGDGSANAGDGSANAGDGSANAGDGSANAGDGSAEPPPDDTNPSDDPHQRCVDRINTLRATLGLPALARWTEQEGCSDQQSANDMADDSPHGHFGACSEFGQNTCPGWGGGFDAIIGGCLDAMWGEGPPPTDPCEGDCFQAHGHYINMTNPGYTKVACGFHDDGTGKIWSNQNFR